MIRLAVKFFNKIEQIIIKVCYQQQNRWNYLYLLIQSLGIQAKVAAQKRYGDDLTSMLHEQPTKHLSVFDHFVGVGVKVKLIVLTVIYSPFEIFYWQLRLEHFE